MYKRLMLGLFAGATLIAAAACSSGGGNVTGNNPLNPTAAPSGFVASASPVASGSSTAPTATPTSMSTSATSTPSPTPSPTPTTGISTTPTPSPSPTSSSSSTLATTCATATGSPSTMMYTFSGAAETIQLPNYPASPPYQITGSSDVPTQTAGSVMTIEISQNSFTNGGSFPAPSGGGTVDFYTTLEFSESTTFGNGSTTLKIPVTIVSPCVVAGRTYTVEESAGGLDDLYSETDTPTANGTVTGHIEAVLNPVPGGEPVFITVSH